MKILHIFPGKVWGGAEQYVLDLGRSLTARGHHVLYLCNDSDPVRQRLDGEVEYTVIPPASLLGDKRLTFLSDFIATNRPDVIHIHHMNMVPLVSRAIDRAGVDARLVLTYHDAHRTSPYLWQRKWFKRLHRMIFVSDFAFHRWHGANRWMPARRCSAILNSVLPQHDSIRQSLRTQYGIESDTPLLAYTGRVRKSKGCELILHALAQLKDLKWHMVFIGGCQPKDYDSKLSAMAADLGIADRVHMHGFSNRVQTLIAEADLGLAPSIVPEGCGLSPLEFMMMGKCVIASDSGAQPEYIDNGSTGIIVPSKDTQALAEAIRRLLDDPSLLTRIGEAAKQKFDNTLSYESFVDKIIRIYSDADEK